MSEHTPGPWQAKQAAKRVDEEYDWGIGAEIDGKRYCIAEAFGRVDVMVRPDAAANARLIAAAPDLLVALKAMVDRWEPDTEGLDRVMWEDACAAIAKATGKESKS